MIIEAILKEIYGGEKGSSHISEQEYVMPENLKQFYVAMKSKEQETSFPCCDSSGSKSCCE